MNLFFKKNLTFLLFILVLKLNWSQSTTFNYTGSVQTYTVPAGVYCIDVDVRGAKGGGSQGGNGARVLATLNVTPGQVLQIYVGGQGTCPSGPNGNMGGGGWNGGGNGVGVSMSSQNPSCGGGGASDIRVAPYGLANRVVVAAGGGGRNGGSSQFLVNGGAGGCATGANGAGSPFTGTGGTGATQIAGGNGGPPWGGGGQYGQNGSIGQGGNGVSGINGAEAHGGGGGGGYYGGGGGGSDGCCNGANGGGAGGGGSSLVPAGGTCTQGFNNGNGLVIITPATPITFNVSSNSPLCIGQTLNLTVSNITGGGGGPYTFSWSGPNGFTSTQQNPSIANIASNQFGDYTVTVTSANGCVTASATVNVQVGSSANITVTPNDTTICLGDSVTISANADIAGGTFSWSNGDQGNVTTVTPSTTETYTVYYDLNGCVSIDSATVNVNPLPNVTISGDFEICLNDTTTLIANGGVNYQWNTGALVDQIVEIPSTNTTYTVTVTDANGCISSSSATVVVNPLPDASFTSDEVCEGNNTLLTNTSTISSGSLTSASWSVSPVTPVGSNSVNHVFPSGGTYPVTLTVTSDKGCNSSITQNVLVYYNPVVNITSNITEGCEPLCVNFIDQTTVTSSNITSWSWKSNNEIFSSDQNPQYCFSNDGLYSIQLDVVSSEGCSSTQIFNDYINVFPTPVSNFEPSSDSVPINNPTILFVNLSQDGSEYLWNFGDGSTSNEFNPTHTYNSIGQYCIELLVTSANGCIDVERKCIKVYGEHFVFIPNSFTPNDDKLNDVFTVKGYGIQNIEMWIFDRWGKQVFYSENLSTGWDGNEMNSKNPLPQGIYVYKIRVTDYKNIEKDYFGFVNLIR